MWIFSIKGFFSVVEHEDSPQQVVIRSRLAKDIQAIKHLFESLRLRTGSILINHRSDYRYRFTANRSDWIAVMIRLMIDLHYPNFKDAVYDTESGEMRERRHDAYLKIWSIMCNLQGFDK
jgi:hypothetical protein